MFHVIQDLKYPWMVAILEKKGGGDPSWSQPGDWRLRSSNIFSEPLINNHYQYYLLLFLCFSWEADHKRMPLVCGGTLGKVQKNM